MTGCDGLDGVGPFGRAPFGHSPRTRTAVTAKDRSRLNELRKAHGFGAFCAFNFSDTAFSRSGSFICAKGQVPF